VASADINGDINPLSLAEVGSFFAFDPGFAGGVFVG
jgi:hypothetical protein